MEILIGVQITQLFSLVEIILTDQLFIHSYQVSLKTQLTHTPFGGYSWTWINKQVGGGGAFNPHRDMISHQFDLLCYMQLSGVKMTSGYSQVPPNRISLGADMYAFHQSHTTLPHN